LKPSIPLGIAALLRFFIPGAAAFIFSWPLLESIYRNVGIFSFLSSKDGSFSASDAGLIAAIAFLFGLIVSLIDDPIDKLYEGLFLWPRWLREPFRAKLTDPCVKSSSPAPATQPLRRRRFRRTRVTAARSSSRRWRRSTQPTCRHSTPVRCCQTPSSGLRAGAYAGRRARWRRGDAPCARTSWMVWRRCMGEPSQMRTSRPGTSRRRGSRKATTSPASLAGSWPWKDRWPSGEIALMAERWSRVHHARRIGVCPMGAEGRTTLGRGYKPDSSMKKRLGCCAAAPV
jgi:hypothetical protein